MKKTIEMRPICIWDDIDGFEFNPWWEPDMLLEDPLRLFLDKPEVQAVQGMTAAELLQPDIHDYGFLICRIGVVRHLPRWRHDAST